MRWLYGTADNALPQVSYGPWSPVYTSLQPALRSRPAEDAWRPSRTPASPTRRTWSTHNVTPAFIYNGRHLDLEHGRELYRVLVFTDEDCLNPVFRGALVGEPGLRSARGRPARDARRRERAHRRAQATSSSSATEPDVEDRRGHRRDHQRDGLVTGDDTSHSGLPPSQVVHPAKVDLWDSDWEGGRYYWTVMPVDELVANQVTTTLTAPTAVGDTTIDVVDATGHQCRRRAARSARRCTRTRRSRRWSATRSRSPVPLGGPHAAGETVVRPCGARHLHGGRADPGRVRVGPRARVREDERAGRDDPERARRTPRASRRTASWSRPRRAPRASTATRSWRGSRSSARGSTRCSGAASAIRGRRPPTRSSRWGTSLTLPLTPGTWYYRVRGLDFLMSGSKPQMSWSDPARVVVDEAALQSRPLDASRSSDRLPRRRGVASTGAADEAAAGRRRPARRAGTAARAGARRRRRRACGGSGSAPRRPASPAWPASARSAPGLRCAAAAGASPAACGGAPGSPAPRCGPAVSSCRSSFAIWSASRSARRVTSRIPVCCCRIVPSPVSFAQRGLDAPDRDAQHDPRAAAVVVGRVLHLADVTAERPRDALRALGRGRERVDVLHPQAQGRLVALQPRGAGGRENRRAERGRLLGLVSHRVRLERRSRSSAARSRRRAVAAR